MIEAHHGTLSDRRKIMSVRGTRTDRRLTVEDQTLSGKAAFDAHYLELVDAIRRLDNIVKAKIHCEYMIEQYSVPLRDAGLERVIDALQLDLYNHEVIERDVERIRRLAMSPLPAN